MSVQRYLPEIPFPEYAYIPGVNEHPHMEAMHGIDHLKYALDLFNHQYFWESHVYFEALWNAEGRKGSTAEFYQAMIKFGAAGVKRAQNQNENAVVHLKRAQELFTSVQKLEGNRFFGFDLGQILVAIDEASSIPRNDLSAFKPFIALYS